MAAHLLQHTGLGTADIYGVRRSDPLFHPAKPPAHWSMVDGRRVSGTLLLVPLAPSDRSDPTQCRPIGYHVASNHLANSYLEDR